MSGMRPQLGGGAGSGGGGGGGYGSGTYGGAQRHRLMCPPPGYKFIPRRKEICGEMGCFTCYDIYCERCESKDRRIIELEMRNNELVKHITLLQARLFPRGGDAGGAPGGGGAQGGQDQPFAYVQSPVLFDPSLGTNYQVTSTFHAVNGQSSGGPPVSPRK
eukprot:TRINITY_DN22662_c0_g1_i1.p1 TRINITY_DN22662_c0_g1~~TRINITY_DN22662_c0_g1_i1.p1  ORF type:complete len:161 (+),score=38.64 TRINITY_DN22662_c0_g1_i1:86-568(+)